MNPKLSNMFFQVQLLGRKLPKMSIKITTFCSKRDLHRPFMGNTTHYLELDALLGNALDHDPQHTGNSSKFKVYILIIGVVLLKCTGMTRRHFVEIEYFQFQYSCFEVYCIYTVE